MTSLRESQHGNNLKTKLSPINKNNHDQRVQEQVQRQNV